MALAILVSLIGGIVLAATAAGRRTESRVPGFLAAHGFDTAVYSFKPAPSGLKLPEVTSITLLLGPDSGRPICRCAHPINPTNFGVLFSPHTRNSLVKLVSGHMPDPSDPDQVLASFTLQQDYGVHLGTLIRVPFFSSAQASAFNNAIGAPPKPDGPTVTFRVVGFEATEFEFPVGICPQLRPVHDRRLCSPRAATDGLWLRLCSTTATRCRGPGPVRLTSKNNRRWRE